MKLPRSTRQFRYTQKWLVLLLGTLVVLAAIVTNDIEKLLIGGAFLGVAPMTGN